MVAAYFPADEYHDRWRRVNARMAEAEFETAVVWGRSAGTYERCGDVLYLTNFYGTSSGHCYRTLVQQGD